LGTTEQEFDPNTYFWIYTYPELAVQNPVIQENFEHILQDEENFDPGLNLLPNQEEKTDGNPCVEAKPKKTKFSPVLNPDSIAARTTVIFW
jgi:hypothetical protein